MKSLTQATLNIENMETRNKIWKLATVDGGKSDG